MDETQILRNQLKRMVEERLKAEQLSITKRRHYEKYDDEEITSAPIKRLITYSPRNTYSPYHTVPPTQTPDRGTLVYQ